MNDLLAQCQKPSDKVSMVAVEMGERAQQGFKHTAVTAFHVYLPVN